MVDETTRRGNQNVYTAGKCLNLGPTTDTAKDHPNGAHKVPAVVTKALSDLGREFARRAQDQDTAALAWCLPAIYRQALNNGESKCGRLASPGLGDPEEISTGESYGDCLGLNGCRFRVALTFEGFENWLGKAEVEKRRQGYVLSYWPRTNSQRPSGHRSERSGLFGTSPCGLGCRGCSPAALD